MRRRSRMMVTILLRLSFAHDRGQVLAIGERFGMFGTVHLRAASECLLEERLSLLIIALGTVEHAQVIEALGSNGMFRSDRLFADGQGLPVEPFRLLVVTLETGENSQGVETFA